MEIKRLLYKEFWLFSNKITILNKEIMLSEPIKFVAMIIAIIVLNIVAHYGSFEGVVIGVLSYLAVKD